MPRKPLVRSQTLPYHVTFRANNKEPFHLPLDIVWEKLCYFAAEVVLLYGVRIHALVLMPNHVHLLITTPFEDLGQVMSRWIGFLTKELNLISGRSGRVFGSRYHWSLINDETYWMNAVRYVYQNPLRADLVKKVEVFPYSSLQFVLGQKAPEYPMNPLRIEVGAYPQFELDLEWLNTRLSRELVSAYRRGFRRSTFKWPNRPERKLRKSKKVSASFYT
jgi:putative transposase